MFSQTYMTLNGTPFVSNQLYGLLAALKTQVNKTKWNAEMSLQIKSRAAWVRSDKTRDFLRILYFLGVLNIKLKSRPFRLLIITNLHQLTSCVLTSFAQWTSHNILLPICSKFVLIICNFWWISRGRTFPYGIYRGNPVRIEFKFWPFLFFFYVFLENPILPVSREIVSLLANFIKFRATI